MSNLPVAPDVPTDSAALLSAVVDTAGSVMVGLRPDHSIFAWNRAAEALYQTPRHEAFGRDYVATFIAPEHRDAVTADIKEVLSGKRTSNFEDDSILPDGTRRTLLWNVTRILGADGEPIGILAMGQDITERKEAEERFRVIFEHVQDGLLLSDSTGVIDCNPAALRILGLTEKSQLIGRRPAEFSPVAQPDGVASELKSRDLGERTKEAGALRFEWVHAQPDGTEVPVDVSVRHAVLSGRRISVVSWHDLTLSRQLEQERTEVQQRLELAQKMEAVGQLAGGVAHDFNNLLTAMRNAIELAADELPAQSEARADLGLALDAAERATGLTRQLLAFSRQQATRVEPVDLAQVARETLTLLRSSIPPSVMLQSTLPDGPVIIAGDRSQLEQVVMNLVLNARDAIPEAGTLAMSLRADSARRMAVLEVEDTGVGMDAATQRRIFEPFFTTKTLGNGTGLGLAVVYGVVTQLGGTVDVESTPGTGSRFTVQLPLGAPASQEPATPEAMGLGNGRELLLVEDEAMVRITTKRLLERLGWVVHIAVDGEDGWELFQRHAQELSVVITDVRMPRLDGIGLTSRVRAAAPEMPILIVSGYDSGDGAAAAAVSRVRFLPKPFDLSQLAGALSALVPATG